MNITWDLLSKYKSQIYGFAILWVVFLHGLVSIKGQLPKCLNFLTGFVIHGNCGVDVFIFMSGITLYFSFVKNQDKLSFFIKRLCRVMIPVLVIDGVYWGYTLIIRQGDYIQFLKNISTYSFWVENNRTIWFVALILLLYFVYPLLYNFLYKISKYDPIYISLLSIVTVYCILILFSVCNIKLYRAMEIALTRIPVFLLGMGCAPFVYNKKSISEKQMLWVIFGVILAFIYFYTNAVSLIKTYRFPYFVFGPCITIFLAYSLEIMNSMNINKFLAFYGEISLEMYLSQVSLCNMCKFLKIFDRNYVHNYYKYVLVCIIFATLTSYIANKFYIKAKSITRPY